MARIHRRLYKKVLNDLDNHNGVVTHQEPDILECEVKWAIGNITMNKPSRGHGIPAELFEILKDDAVQALTQYISKFRKPESGHKPGKVSFHSNPKERQCQQNVQTTIQLHLFHMLAK